MDVVQAQSFLRKRYLQAIGKTFYEEDSVYKELFGQWAAEAYVYGTANEQIVHVDPNFTLEKAKEITQYRQEMIQQETDKRMIDGEFEGIQDVAIDMLQDYAKTCLKLRQCSPITKRENKLLQLLEQVQLQSLLGLVKSKSIVDLQAFFLELVVMQNAPSPQILSFELLYNLNIRLDQHDLNQSAPVASSDTDIRLELFYLFIDMAERSLEINFNSDRLLATLLNRITRTLLLFARPNGTWLINHLLQLTASGLLFKLLKYREQHQQCPNQSDTIALLEGLIFGFYFKRCDEHNIKNTLGSRRGSIKRVCSTLVILPTDEMTGAPKFDIECMLSSPALLDSLLGFYYSLPCITIHQLLFMAFFDATKANLLLPFDTAEELFQKCFSLGLPSLLAMYPLSMWRQVGGLGNENFMDELCKLVRVDDYFAKSTLLSNIIKKSKIQTLDLSHHTPETFVLQKIFDMLGDSEDRFKAERWLAEVIVDAQKPDIPVFGQPNMDVFTYDEHSALRLAARSRFWESLRAKSFQLRLSMIRVLRHIIQRRFGNQSIPLTTLLRDVNAVASVIVDNKEENSFVLLPLLVMILELCIRKCNYYYQRTVQSEKKIERTKQSTLITQLLAGELALDVALLHEVSPEFYVYALDVLNKEKSPWFHKDAYCQDVAMVLAIVVKFVFSDIHLFSRSGGLLRIISELLVQMIKTNQHEQYAQCLKDMQLVAQDTNNECVLGNPYLHCRSILQRFYQINQIPLEG
ncbi:hypothetical protein THRCLA_21426 [Thraustotheca clavata]|uniref:Uncharacterized protein n=1 Tax=Thraustotheca clavata TaxID=74557 RepID=A0A1V9ZWK3_9STRA|nr:hypothetical protein THRCLA_21426 [Thraustotheca clavata]